MTREQASVTLAFTTQAATQILDELCVLSQDERAEVVVGRFAGSLAPMTFGVRVFTWVSATVLSGGVLAACGGTSGTSAPLAGSTKAAGAPADTASTAEPMREVAFETTADRDLEAAVLRASPSYTKAVVDAGGASGRARYIYNRVDLNDDGQQEVFVYLLGSIFCGTGGCNLQLFTQRQAGYTLVNEFSISRTPVVVSQQKTGGWKDIFKLESGGGAPATYVRYTFDGTKYVERERMAATAAPEGMRYLAGELTFDKGISLEPGDETTVARRGPAAPAPSPTGFSTVCGVTAEGRDPQRGGRAAQDSALMPSPAAPNGPSNGARALARTKRSRRAAPRDATRC